MNRLMAAKQLLRPVGLGEVQGVQRVWPITPWQGW